VPPTHIGKYEVQRRLGGGGMGSLYLARDPGLDRFVAVKLLREEYEDDPELRERFRREARSVARLRHPNIITVFDVGEDGRRPFIVMEYLAGDTLKAILQLHPPLPLPDRLALAEELLAGLAHAHAAGIIHRDIKPANIMLDGDGVLKILDFGIARLGASGMTQDGVMLGTVNYMSPEQIVGRGVGHSTDIFAAGAVLYELIALGQAFPGQIDSGVLNRILHERPTPIEERVPGIDAELARIVRRALERDQTQRYQDANTMLRDLSRVRRRLLHAERTPEAQAEHDPTMVSQPVSSASSAASGGADAERPRRLDAERFAELRRRQVDEQLRLGEGALARGEPQAALEHAERAATIDPDSRAAYDLIDRSTFAVGAAALHHRLAEAQRLLAEGHLDEAGRLVEELSATSLPDVPAAADLRDELRRVAEEVAAARERRQRIAVSLERARSAIDRGGYDTALRAVYEVLAIDPDLAEARDLEQDVKSQLQAQRELARATQAAFDQLERARVLAAEGRYDQAVATLNAVEPPSDTIRAALAGAVAQVLEAQRVAAHAATVERARKAFTDGRFAEAIRRLESIPGDYVTPGAAALRADAETALQAQREREQKRFRLDALLSVVSDLVTEGDLSSALDGLEDAAKLGIEDPRIASMREQIEALRAAEFERQRQAARERRAVERAGQARELLSGGNGSAAIALLEQDDTGHPIVQQALVEIRRTVAEQEERERVAAERRRNEEEERARLAAERRRQEEEEHARVEAEQRKREEALEAERRRKEEEERARLEAERRQEEEELARVEAERRKREEARLEGERRRREEEERARLAAEGRRQEEEKRVRLEAERRRKQEEDARQKAEVEAARREQERRAEETRRHTEERERRYEQLAAALTSVEQALVADRLDEAAAILGQTDQIVADVGDPDLTRRRMTRRLELEQKRREKEEARRREEEARRREAALTRILRRADEASAHAAALALLQEALTIAPDDPRVQTLVVRRTAALEQERSAAEERRVDEQRRDEERRQAAASTAGAGPDAALLTDSATAARHPQRAALEAPPTPVAMPRTRRPDVPAARLHDLARDRRVQGAAAALIVLLLGWVSWQWQSGTIEPDALLVETGPATTPLPSPTPSAPSGNPAPRPVPASPVPAPPGPTPLPAPVGRGSGGTVPAPAPGPLTAPPAPAPQPRPAPDTAEDRPLTTPGPSPQPPVQPPVPAPTPQPAPPTEMPQPSLPVVDIAAEQLRIRRLLDEYVQAYNRLDEARIRQIDPTSGGIPGRSGGLLRGVEVTYSDLVIDVAPNGESATLQATQHFRWDFRRAGMSGAKTGRLNWKLRKLGDQWMVVP
jgi:hypothetical protein